jgi:hypothetical protein
MKNFEELSGISREIQAQLLERKLSFSEIRYVLSEVQGTFALMQTAQYVKKNFERPSTTERNVNE